MRNGVVIFTNDSYGYCVENRQQEGLRESQETSLEDSVVQKFSKEKWMYGGHILKLELSEPMDG